MPKPMHPRDRCQGLLDEAEQMITDIQSYNDNHPEDPPFDCERERVIVALARQALARWRTGDYPSGQGGSVFRPLWVYIETAYAQEESEGPI